MREYTSSSVRERDLMFIWEKRYIFRNSGTRWTNQLTNVYTN